jgi:coproporphyrinogen III oxidase
MKALVEDVQRQIIDGLEALDPSASFQMDDWAREGGGGGLTGVVEGGAVWEKGGVNTSAVHGDLPARMAEALGVEAQQFFATGVSLVIHPVSPHVPTVHANYRYFALGDDLDDPEDQWFGGGADLTPYLPRLEDAQHFHRVWKDVCGRHPDVADYDAFKRQCDDYFYLPHRQEARGVGGIFYDYLRDDPEATFAFSKDAGHAFLDAYLPIAERRLDEAYGETERHYQTVRRGRYVEFNLLFDRGTKFGIETRGRTESILMSLPPEVRWHYDWHPEPGTPAAEAQWFFQPRDWLSLEADDVPGDGD